jgi:fibronectin type 3 domain-containing protein
MLLRRRHTSAAVSVLVAIALLASAQAALAVFNKAVLGGPLTVATSTLAPAKGVTATQVNCRLNKNPEIEVEWTATSSTYASTYNVERATASAGPYTAVDSVPIGETSYTDKSGSLGYSTTYYYRITVVDHSWSAPSTVVSVKTLGKICLSV